MIKCGDPKSSIIFINSHLTRGVLSIYIMLKMKFEDGLPSKKTFCFSKVFGEMGF